MATRTCAAGIPMCCPHYTARLNAVLQEIPTGLVTTKKAPTYPSSWPPPGSVQPWQVDPGPDYELAAAVDIADTGKDCQHRSGSEPGRRRHSSFSHFVARVPLYLAGGF